MPKSAARASGGHASTLLDDLAAGLLAPVRDVLADLGLCLALRETRASSRAEYVSVYGGLSGRR